MDNKFPKFSVIIPQKNRAEYLRYTLLTCMSQDYPNFEIIVSDDCSDDNSVEVVEELQKRDSRIKLFAHKSHLGMRENFEFALNKVEPGYVMALGGDDGLVPGCIQRMYELIKESGRDLLTWTPAGFQYANKDSNGHNIFLVKRKKFNGIKIVKSKDFLQKICRTYRYQIDECPMFYMKGVVSTELVNRVKSRTKDGSFYYCPTPDGFSGVVLAGEVEDYAYVCEPLSIVGTTTKSQGQNYRRTDEQSRKESIQFFNDNIRRTMHEQLASQQYSPLETLMTADYLLTAKDLPGWPGKCYDISIKNLFVQTFKMLKSSYFDSSVLEREMKILNEIAKQHDLQSFLLDLISKSKKSSRPTKQTFGFLITNSIRFDGSEIGIHNIFDAANAVNFVYNIQEKISFKEPVRVLFRTLSVILNTKHNPKTSYPKYEL